MTAEFVVIGRVAGLYGVKGWLKVVSFTASRENIKCYKPWYLRVNNQQRALEVEDVKTHGKGIIAKLTEVVDRDEAAEYLQADILIRREQLPELPESEFYWHDLQHLRVLNQTGVELGIVDYLLETGANDVLVVRDQQGHETLIPYIRGDIVKDIDLESGVIRVDWEADY